MAKFLRFRRSSEKFGAPQWHRDPKKVVSSGHKICLLANLGIYAFTTKGTENWLEHFLVLSQCGSTYPEFPYDQITKGFSGSKASLSPLLQILYI